MEILIGQRQSGKTSYLIKQSAESNGIIVAPTECMAKFIKEQAEEMGLKIQEPISWRNFLKGYRCKNGPILIDELGIVLNLMGITTATLDINYVKNIHGEKS